MVSPVSGHLVQFNPGTQSQRKAGKDVRISNEFLKTTQSRKTEECLSENNGKKISVNRRLFGEEKISGVQITAALFGEGLAFTEQGVKRKSEAPLRVSERLQKKQKTS